MKSQAAKPWSAALQLAAPLAQLGDDAVMSAEQERLAGALDRLAGRNLPQAVLADIGHAVRMAYAIGKKPPRTPVMSNELRRERLAELARDESTACAQAAARASGDVAAYMRAQALAWQKVADAFSGQMDMLAGVDA